MAQNNQKNILILYGSTTGNSQRLAKYLKNNIHNFFNNKQISYKALIKNVADLDYPFVLPDNHDLTIICTSTWGIEPAVLQEDLEYWCINTNKSSVANKNFALFILGDKTYPHFAYGYEILQEYITKCQGLLHHNLSLKIQDPWEDNKENINKILNEIKSII